MHALWYLNDTLPLLGYFVFDLIRIQEYYRLRLLLLDETGIVSAWREGITFHTAFKGKLQFHSSSFIKTSRACFSAHTLSVHTATTRQAVKGTYNLWSLVWKSNLFIARMFAFVRRTVYTVRTNENICLSKIYILRTLGKVRQSGLAFVSNKHKKPSLVFRGKFSFFIYVWVTKYSVISA